MSTPVPQTESAFDIAGVRTGQPVVSAGFSRISAELAFLLGYDLHDCGGAQPQKRPAGRTSLVGLTFTVRVPYARSPGAQVVRVAVELNPSDEDETQTLTVTLPTGATWLDAQGLDGTVNFPNPPLGRPIGQELVGWADVSAVTVGDLDLNFAFKCTPAATKAGGIRRCAVVEVPLAALNNVSTEPVLDGASVRPGRLVIDGGSGTTDGTQRIFHLLDNARASMRQHVCLAGIESADVTAAAVTPHWYRETATYGAINWLHTSGSYDVVLYVHPRKLYGTTASTTWYFVVRYRTSNGTACGVKLYAEGGTIDSTTRAWTAASAASAQTLSLAGTSGSWAWATVAVTLPGDSAEDDNPTTPTVYGHMVKVWFEAKGPGAGQLLSLATLGLLENEP